MFQNREQGHPQMHSRRDGLTRRWLACERIPRPRQALDEKAIPISNLEQNWAQRLSDLIFRAMNLDVPRGNGVHPIFSRTVKWKASMADRSVSYPVGDDVWQPGPCFLTH